MIALFLIAAGWYVSRLVVAEAIYYTPSPIARAAFILALLGFDITIVGAAYFFDLPIKQYLLYFAGAKAITICFMDYNHLLYLDLNERPS